MWNYHRAMKLKRPGSKVFACYHVLLFICCLLYVRKQLGIYLFFLSALLKQVKPSKFGGFHWIPVDHKPQLGMFSYWFYHDLLIIHHHISLVPKTPGSVGWVGVDFGASLLASVANFELAGGFLSKRGETTKTQWSRQSLNKLGSVHTSPHPAFSPVLNC